MKWNGMKKNKKQTNKKKKMDSLANLIITGLILNKFLGAGYFDFDFVSSYYYIPNFLIMD